MYLEGIELKPWTFCAVQGKGTDRVFRNVMVVRINAAILGVSLM